MQITFMGTGTSVGVPMIGCDCAVCTSSDPRNRRRRTSLYVEACGTHLVVDTAPDFREQVLSCGVTRIDAVLFTHSHADHIFGFDDIRRFNTIQDGVIPAYGSAETIADLRRVYDYIDTNHDPGVFRPRIAFETFTGPFRVGAIDVSPIKVVHPGKMTVGFRLDAGGKSVGYVPDCHELAPEAERTFMGVDVMILDGLRHRPHPTHLTVETAVRHLQTIAAPQSFLIHMCHDLDHAETEAVLPEDIRLSYDGLRLSL